MLQDVKPTLEDVDRRRQRREHQHDLIVRPARLDNEPVVEAPLLGREGLWTRIDALHHPPTWPGRCFS